MIGPVLVTGGSGFLGRHLLAALVEIGPVVTFGRRKTDTEHIPGDIDDADALARAVDVVRPRLVFHLAALVPPAPACRLYRINTGGTANLLAALAGRRARLVLAGSAAELGPVPVEDLPIVEDKPCRPAGPYALSKWCASRLALAASKPLEVVVARLFNPIGPGLPASQALGRYARDLAAPGPDPVLLTVGDLDSRRDFLDVRDAAAALVALARRGRPGQVYHVGTGRSRRVGDGLDALIRLSGRRVVLEPHAHHAGPSSPADSRADIRKIVAETGWRPAIPWEQTLADLWAANRMGPKAAVRTPHSTIRNPAIALARRGDRA
ncbi:MAG TPA: NAD-dependent epimerase/dehydratase family protein [Isosphaeraceae bacterium]|jgi:GDP-4-dehydro-6-deoxy-D-mannose reductase|nr:NAD-dependent epimerase/dehydratase family protein [Isosphaeraceae bacterium]